MRRIVGYTEVIGLASGCGSRLQGNNKPGERDREGDGQPEIESDSQRGLLRITLEGHGPGEL
jgi:hypothetical protein